MTQARGSAGLPANSLLDFFAKDVHSAEIDNRFKDAAMDHRAQLRADILRSIVEDLPLGFWSDLSDRARWVYEESYDSNAHDPRIRPTQAGFKTIDDRFYFFENVLTEVAEANGVLALPEQIRINGWRYTLLRSGRITATAKYVYTPGDMASPARFRQQLAEMNTFNREPPLPFEGVALTTEPAQVNGIILHGPLSRRFEEDGFRHLGFLNFAVPWDDYSGWVANFPVPEILAAYESNVERSSDPTPVWKSRKDRRAE